MSFKVEIVADSIGEFSPRITTMVVTFPRIILAEAKTHRMLSGLEGQVEIEESVGLNDDRNLSRNSASSRAIPFAKMVRSVEENPFIPIAWQKDHKGMQGTEYFTQDCDINLFKNEWLLSRDEAVKSAKILANCGVTKQLCNRKLELYMWHTVIVTATEWENFFALRCGRYKVAYKGGDDYHIARSRKEIKLERVDHFVNKQGEKIYPNSLNWTDLDWLLVNHGAAEIHMMKLAEMMWDAYCESTPKLLQPGEWHIPYNDRIDLSELSMLSLKNSPTGGVGSDGEWKEQNLINSIKISTVMAARTSYTVVGEDLKPLSYERMIEIHDQLIQADPKHMSPFEHCAQLPPRPFLPEIYESNLKGWRQYRKMIPGENITK